MNAAIQPGRNGGVLKKGNPGPWPGAGAPSRKFTDKCIELAPKAAALWEKVIDGEVKDKDGNPVNVSIQDRLRATDLAVKNADIAAVIPRELADKVVKVIRNLDTIVGRKLGLTAVDIQAISLALDREMAGYRIE